MHPRRRLHPNAEVAVRARNNKDANFLLPGDIYRTCVVIEFINACAIVYLCSTSRGKREVLLRTICAFIDTDGSLKRNVL